MPVQQDFMLILQDSMSLLQDSISTAGLKAGEYEI